MKIPVIDQIRTMLQAFSEGTIPVGGKIFKTKSTEFSEIQSDKYEDVEKLLNDEKIYSIVALIASLVQSSYKGVQLKPEDKYTDNELTESERKVLKLAEKFVGDVEGLDYEVLSQWPFNTARPKVICIEMLTNEYEEIIKSKIHALLSKNDYKINYWLTPSIIYVREFNSIFKH